MTQLSFEDLPPQDIYEGIASHIVDAFTKFHRENPGVYSLFTKYANQLMSHGVCHYGSKAILERIRWHYEIDEKSKDFKLNNNFASCYSRLLMHQDPSFRTFFSTRSHRDLKAA